MAAHDPGIAERWRSTFATWRSSDLSVAAFCRSRDLNLSSFYRWRKILDDLDRPATTRPRSEPAALPIQSFVPVRVIPDAVVEVILPSGLQLRVPLSADAQQLARLVLALARSIAMLNLGTTGLIYVAVAPQDGRKGIDGLAGVVRTTLGRDPGSGDRFVFKNRRGDKLKILAWMGDGFALYLRRLEKGTFAFPTAVTPELAITTTQLAMILGGIEWTQTRARTRFQQPV